MLMNKVNIYEAASSRNILLLSSDMVPIMSPKNVRLLCVQEVLSIFIKRLTIHKWTRLLGQAVLCRVWVWGNCRCQRREPRWSIAALQGHQPWNPRSMTTTTMLLILDGNSEIGAHARSKPFYLTCLRHLIQPKEVAIFCENAYFPSCVLIMFCVLRYLLL